MGIELVLRLEVPADQADRELGEVVGQRVVEAAILAELLGTVGEMRAPEPRIERPAQAAARPRDDGIGYLLLFGRELGEIERSQTRHETISFGYVGRLKRATGVACEALVGAVEDAVDDCLAGILRLIG